MSLTVSHGLHPRGPLPLTKTALDRLGAAVLLLLAAPWMAALAVVLWSHDDGPVLHREARLGQWDRPFHLLRFRVTGPGLTTGRVGALLQRTCLDELPQLINVLRGEMSLVGPRAEAPGHARPHGTTLARSALRPGLTGLGALARGRADEDTSAVVDRYLREWSLGLDLLILGRALGRAVRGPVD
ncbi:sugar transferase [Modestobacter sp. L9-4]|uniref:sugar transferase n=1 Tax=Modestobacter sp. L9-4 TaxID=2851567 RepID=UPI001C73F921|nr:sugar transferase [Modestobacter sp. L9-4]QXG74800.1 sugar transferase [Modestobacter sp. L9-4]